MQLLWVDNPELPRRRMPRVGRSQWKGECGWGVGEIFGGGVFGKECKMESEVVEVWVGEGSKFSKITWFLEIHIPHAAMRVRGLYWEMEGEESHDFRVSSIEVPFQGSGREREEKRMDQTSLEKGRYRNRVCNSFWQCDGGE
jgi:hypothetical protein